MANTTPRCELCVFSRKRGTGTRRECRCRPPRFIAGTSELANAKIYELHGIWPSVDDDDWCGKFRKSLPPHQSELSYEMIPSKTMEGALTMIPCRIVK